MRGEQRIAARAFDLSRVGRARSVAKFYLSNQKPIFAAVLEPAVRIS
jgi:hypothetical protein